MEDSQLTRMAIEEIVRELGERRPHEHKRHERKFNPLGKPNKRFLGRTLSSVLTHNKRNSDRTQANCRRKLEELDKRLRRGVLRQFDEEKCDEAEQTHSSRKPSEVTKKRLSRTELRSSSSSCSEKETRSKKRKKSRKRTKTRKLKKKRKVKKSRKRSKSEVSDGNTSRSRSRSRSKRSAKENKSSKKSSEPPQKGFDEQFAESDSNYYQALLDDHIGSTVFDNATLHSVYNQQVQQLLCYQAMLASIQKRTANAAAFTNSVVQAFKDEFEDSPSEVSSSSSWSLTSELAEGDEMEDGVLTIHLSSDDSASLTNTCRRRKKRKPESPELASCSSTLTFDLCSNSPKRTRGSQPSSRATTPCICLDSDSNDSIMTGGKRKGAAHDIGIDFESEDSIDRMISASNAKILAYSSSLRGKMRKKPHVFIDLTGK